MREVRCPRSGKSCEEVRVVNASLFKSLGKQLLSLEFYLNLAGCGGDIGDEYRTTQ